MNSCNREKKELNNKLDILIENNIRDDTISKIMDIEELTNSSEKIGKLVWQKYFNKLL